MVKNKLEKLFSKSLKAADTLWGMKLHNNMLAHQTTPADYILTNNSNKVILVECKQVTCNEGKGRFAFKRLKQLHDLISFQTLKPFHLAYLCLAFHDETWANSDVYIVPITRMKDIIYDSSCKSINKQKAQKTLEPFKVEIEHGVMNLWQLK